MTAGSNGGRHPRRAVRGAEASLGTAARTDGRTVAIGSDRRGEPAPEAAVEGGAARGGRRELHR